MVSQPDGIQLHETPARVEASHDSISDVGFPALAENASEASTANMLYASAPLDDSPTAIRVLEVERDLHFEDTTVFGNLVVVDLADHPHFTALSYVWGNPADQEFIWCSQQPIPATRNALEALRHLRDKFSSLRIWVDAICINQSDEAEKIRQIRMMDAIYSSATHVYIWLGEGNQTTPYVMDYLSRGALPYGAHDRPKVADLLDRSHPSLKFATKIPTGQRVRRKLLLSIRYRSFYHFRRPPLYAEIQDFFAHEWVQRLWTLQEVLLARSPVIVCGGYHVSWFAFLCAVEVFEYMRLVGGERSKGLRLPQNLEPWLQLASIWRFCHSVQKDNEAILPAGQIRSPGAGNDQCPVQLGLSLLELHSDQIFVKNTDSGVDMKGVSSVAVPFAIATGLLLLFGISQVLIAGFSGIWSFALSLFPLMVYIVFDMVGTQGPDELQDFLHAQGNSIPAKLMLMTQIAARHCGRPQDRYYAVQGIIGRPGQATRDDHGTSLPGIEQLDRGLCLELVSWSRSLDFLLFLSSAAPQNTPSWVAQWGRADALWATYRYRADLQTRGPILILDNQSTIATRMRGATLDSDPWVKWNPCNNELTVRALYLTQIDWKTLTNPEESTRQQEKSIDQQMKAIAKGQPRGDTNIIEAYRRPFIKRAVRDNRAVIRWFLPMMIIHDVEERDLRVGDKLCHTYGLAPESLRIGDQLFLISGLSMPIVLRLTSSNSADGLPRYQVVGPAFIPDMMEGQLWSAKLAQFPVQHSWMYRWNRHGRWEPHVCPPNTALSEIVMV